jgi:hypothetical protein
VSATEEAPFLQEPVNATTSWRANVVLLAPLLGLLACVLCYVFASSTRHQGLHTSLPDVTLLSDALDADFKDMPTFVTMETRGDPLLVEAGTRMKKIGMKTGFSGKMVNVGEGKKWEGYTTKVKLLTEYMRSQDGDKLFAIVDGGDVFWGGCKPSSFMDAYKSIVKASGAPIVFSSEVVCSEQECNKVPDVPAWASKLEDGTEDLNGGFWKKYAMGCKGTWNDACSEEKNCNTQLHGESTAPCSVPPAVRFLNSGVIIGPAKELSEMLDWTFKNYGKVSSYGDQSVFATYWLDNQDKVTLDYRGELSTSLSDLFNLFQVNREEGIIQNKAFDRPQCLLHGNGRGQFEMMRLMAMLTGKPPQQLLDWEK